MPVISSFPFVCTSQICHGEETTDVTNVAYVGRTEKANSFIDWTDREEEKNNPATAGERSAGEILHRSHVGPRSNKRNFKSVRGDSRKC